MKNCISLLDLGKAEVLKILALGERLITHVRDKKLLTLNYLSGRGILEGEIFCRERELAEQAIDLQAGKVPPLLKLLFLEDSLRTQGSTAEAARRLGFDCHRILGKGQTSMSKGESLLCTIRMLLNQGADIIGMRTTEEGAPRLVSEMFDVPIINCGDGCNRHPTQALLDLLTIKQTLGRLEDFTMAIIGDIKQSRVARCLFTAARIFGFRVALVCPPENSPPEIWLKGVNVVKRYDQLADLHDCDFAYLLRFQKERSENPLDMQRALRRFQITRKALDDFFSPNVKLLHAQPIDQSCCTLETFPDVFADRRTKIIQEQAHYGLPTRVAILLLSWLHRKDKVKIPEPGEPQVEVFFTGSVKEHLETLHKKHEAAGLRPVKKGVVIDHMPLGGCRLVQTILNRAKIDFSGRTLSPACSKKMGRKDMYFLDDTEIPPYILAAISVLLPGTTFVICDGTNYRKVKFPNPKVISGILSCPNRRCICSTEKEAKTRFYSLEPESEGQFICAYCEQTFSAEELRWAVTA